jgi:hypothetical protein
MYRHPAAAVVGAVAEAAAAASETIKQERHMFDKVSYRRGLIEAIIIYTSGRLGALITPAFFPDWMFVAVPLLFLVLQYLLPPFWVTRRISSSKRERLSKRFWWLGPRLASMCIGINLLLSLIAGLPVSQFDIQKGPVLLRLFETGQNHLSLVDFAIIEVKSASLIFVLYMLTVICTRLAHGGMLRFTMPAGENRVTL